LKTKISECQLCEHSCLLEPFLVCAVAKKWKQRK
jgi:hypothetical protein